MEEVIGRIEIEERDPVSRFRIRAGQCIVEFTADSILTKDDIRKRLVLAADAIKAKAKELE